MILVFFLYAFNDAHILPEHCEFRLKVKRIRHFNCPGSPVHGVIKLMFTLFKLIQK